MSKPLKIAVAGLGTVGAGVIRLLREHEALLEHRCGRKIVVTAVSARERNRDRGIDLAGYRWFDDPIEMARQADADIVVELVGGSDGVAPAITEAAINAGRDVVTANKAMIALHGTELARKAELAGVSLAYEAAVAGGIPVIKALREGLAGNRVTRLHGILNGTCNYILSTMREAGLDFDEVLLDAQRLGYAEADPGFDIDGIDAAHKLAILTSVAFGTQVDFASVYVEGIRNISGEDIAYATELGYRIKLLGIAERTELGIQQRVHPTMVPIDAPIAAVEGVFNGIEIAGDYVGTSVLEGKGAGAGPTASAVVADIVDLAYGRRTPTFGVPVRALSAPQPARMDDHVGPYYVRLSVMDRAGVFADIAAALRDYEISIESVLQRGHAEADEDGVPVVIVTHNCREASIKGALDQIRNLQTMREPARMIRIETFGLV